MTYHLIFFAGLSAILGLMIYGSAAAMGHQDFQFGNLIISPGWQIEPPLQGQLNAIEVKLVTGEDSTPVRNAFSSLEASIQYGGVSKKIEFSPQEEAGLYRSPIIPDQVGTYTLILKGSVNSQEVDASIQIETVEDTNKLIFPQTPSSSSHLQGDQIAEQVKLAIDDLTNRIQGVRTAAEDAQQASQDSKQSIEKLQKDAERAYIFGMIGIGLGAAGIITGITAINKKLK